MALVFVPAHVNEATEQVDNLGGVLSVVMVGGADPGDQLRAGAERATIALSLAIVAVLARVAFVIRQRRARNPLYDLHIAARRIFWVAALRRDHRVRLADGGDVHQPAVPPERARLLHPRGGRRVPAGRGVHGPGRPAVGEARGVPRRPVHPARRATCSCCSGSWRCCCSGRRTAPYWRIGIAYAFLGIGVGFAGTPASHSLTGSVPVRRAGMASGTADLQRDLGGAIMQSIFGALLTAGYASAASAAIAASPTGRRRSSDSVQNELTRSFASAADTAEQYPQYADGIIAGAKQAFLDGDQWAYTAGHDRGARSAPRWSSSCSPPRRGAGAPGAVRGRGRRGDEAPGVTAVRRGGRSPAPGPPPPPATTRRACGTRPSPAS